MSKWAKHTVTCEQCSAHLMRYLIRPKDGKRIERFFCDTSCKGAWQRAQRPWTEEWLRQKYEAEGLSANDIAAIVDRHPKRVWEWLRDAGIETRSRGHFEANWIKPGEQLSMGRSLSDDHKEKLREARRRDGSKGLFKNGHHVLKGRKGRHHPRWKGGLTPERQAFYSSDEWKTACVEVWRRSDAKCERCGLDHRTIDRSKIKFHVHHIVSFQVRELRAVTSNLKLLCESCHRFVHSKKNINQELIGEYHGIQSA